MGETLETPGLAICGEPGDMNYTFTDDYDPEVKAQITELEAKIAAAKKRGCTAGDGTRSGSDAGLWLGRLITIGLICLLIAYCYLDSVPAFGVDQVQAKLPEPDIENGLLS